MIVEEKEKSKEIELVGRQRHWHRKKETNKVQINRKLELLYSDCMSAGEGRMLLDVDRG